MTRPFGQLPNGQSAQLFTLQNAHGFRADVSDYGATLVNLFVPDQRGQLADVTLGFESVAGYIAHQSYFGAVIGRCGNRLAHGRFVLDGRAYQLATNNEPGGRPCHLHGGLSGFDRKLWRAEPFRSAEGPSVLLHYRSPAGEEGYPGTLDVTVTYTVTDANALRLDYEARSDAPTIVNLTNHAYFNLGGEGSGDVLDHVVTFRAPAYTPVDAGLIPTGQVAPVAGTPFDFLTPHPIGERIDAAHEQLRLAGGYDHNFVLSHPEPGGLDLAATVFDPSSGRLMEVLTTEPGMQFYTGNFLDGKTIGKQGHAYAYRNGFCLETQHFPDSANQSAFPSIVLRPGGTLRSTTVYRFGLR